MLYLSHLTGYTLLNLVCILVGIQQHVHPLTPTLGSYRMQGNQDIYISDYTFNPAEFKAVLVISILLAEVKPLLFSNTFCDQGFPHVRLQATLKKCCCRYPDLGSPLWHTVNGVLTLL